jgi:PKD domain/Bacterial Ig domain
MRRSPHVLAFVFGAAAVLLLAAPALAGPPPLIPEPEQSLPPTAGIQHSPAIAVDPAAPNRAVVTSDDGNGPPPPPFASTVSGATTDWTTASWTAGGMPQYSGASAGQADVAWGVDDPSALPTPEQNVYMVETGSSGGTPATRTLCSTDAGILFSASTDGGVSYTPANSAFPVDSGSNTTELVEPAIAVAGSNIYITYTALAFPNGGCTGTPSSTVWLVSSSDGGNTWAGLARRVTPFASSSRYRSSSVAALPDGRVIVAFRNDATSSPQIETETCTPFSPLSANYCGVSSSAVGPSTIVGDATAPALVSEVVGPPTPSVIAAVGRVTVAWSASVDANVRAFAAMSTDNGVSYGPPTQIDPNGLGNQVAPELAATAGGRVDVAYLWDSGLGGVQATAVSANPPLPGATTEAWAQPIVVQGVPAGGATPIGTQLAPLGRRLGVATAAIAGSPLPATVVAFTDTTAGQDIHVVGLLHGTTPPTIAPQTVTASKNVTTIVQVSGSDDDGDPLTWSVGAQPTTPGSSVSVADAARGQFAFTAANQVLTDTFTAVATDGVAGHEVSATITVNVVNDPPKINCSLLFANEDTPLEIPASCVTDPNSDPLTVTLDSATKGTVERVSGNWFFVPATHSTAQASFMLHAFDGLVTVNGLVTVTVSPPIGKVTLVVQDAGKRRTLASGLAVRFAGHAIDAQGHPVAVTWNFGDKTPTVTGSAVAHRFRNSGAFTVKASASTATPVVLHVLVRRHAVELMDAPQVTNGVMSLRVRTRAAGELTLRVDSRSQTIAVPAGMTQRVLRIQVTTGPLVRLTLRLRPSKSTLLPSLSVQRLVLVPAPSAG